MRLPCRFTWWQWQYVHRYSSGLATNKVPFKKHKTELELGNELHAQKLDRKFYLFITTQRHGGMPCFFGIMNVNNK